MLKNLAIDERPVLSLTDESTAPLKNTIMPSPSHEYLWIRWNSTSATTNDNTHLQVVLALLSNSALVQDIFLIPSNPTYYYYSTTHETIVSLKAQKV